MTHVYHEGDEPIPGAGYRLVQFLGRGGFGEVWKATTPGGAEAAVKIIPLGGAEGRKEFRALQLVKRIRHPNLMPLVAFWLKGEDGSVLDDALAEQPELARQSTVDDPSCIRSCASDTVSARRPAELVIVMGLGDKSLMDRLEECRVEGLSGIPVEELLGYMEDAAEAIDYLNQPVHDQGAGPIAVQHCDIKPHNLMIVGGAVQVCDFGLARMMGSNRATTGAASLAYAAPELLENNKVSPSTDQYSLAVTYYELRAGKLPYAEGGVVQVLEAKYQNRLDCSACTPAEQVVLRRATSCTPADRFPSTLEMVKALRRAATATTRPDGWQAGAQSRRRGHRRVGPTLAICLLAASLLVAAVYGTRSYWRPWTQGFPRVPPDRVARAPATLPAVPIEPAPRPQPGEMEKAAAASAKLVAASVKTSSATPFEATLQRGTSLLEKGEYDRAVTELAAAIGLAPQDVRPLSRRGVAWLRKGQFQKAVDDFTAALRIAPDAKDHVNRGLAYRGLNQANQAIADFDAALRLNPDCASAHFFRSDCQLKLNRYDEAIADASQAIELATKTPDPAFALADAYTLRGSAYVLQEHPSLAVKDLTAAIRLDPKDLAAVHQLRAAAYESEHRPDLAKCDNEIAALFTQIEGQPADPAPYRRLASLLATSPEADLREGRKAVELANRACELSMRKNPEDLDVLAAAYAEVGQFDRAVGTIKQAIELAANTPSANLYRARMAQYENHTPLRQPTAP
jgi:serine/threonine protein kinase/cytochrome c-type biogenesis protein CcmH/NrfG